LITHGISIIASFLYIIGLYQVSLNYMITGRILSGISVGLGHSLVPLYVKEMSPVSLSGMLGMFHQINVMIGILIASLVGIGIRKGDADMIWLYLMFGFPMITCFFSVIMFIVKFTYDTPKFNLIKRRPEKAREVFRTIYKDEYIAG